MTATEKPAKSYATAIKTLAKCEVLHRQNLDRLDAAITARQAHQVTPLRRDCAKSEQDLDNALETALSAHKAYWIARRDEFADDIRDLAVVIREYDACARLAGDTTAGPGILLLQKFILDIPAPEVVCDELVPPESPDCELLEDFRGSWRA